MSPTAGWCIVKKGYGLCAILSKPVFTPPLSGWFETSNNPKEKPMLLRMAESFCVTFGSEELRPLSLFFLPDSQEEDRFESPDWVCELLDRITIKRSAQEYRFTFLLLPCDWSGMRSPQEGFLFSKWEPGSNLLLGQRRPKACGQGQISSQPKQMCSLVTWPWALIGMS